jgi:hypothetical protein
MDLDKNGLIFSGDVKEESGRFFCEGEEIYAAPECRGIISHLLKDRKLWGISRIRFNRTDIRMKRAPIIAVPFSKALGIAIQSPYGFQKSMYQVPNWTIYAGKAVIATMLAHTSASHELVELEAWQFLDVSNETFYVHCIIDKKKRCVIHFDGATMIHTEAQRNQIQHEAAKIKGEGYQKHFRLDGEIIIDTAAILMDLYFPAQTLTREFLDILKD